MKKIKYIVIGIAIGIIIVGSISVYAVEAVIESEEVSYNNESSGGSSENVQGSIDELYERSGVMKEKWKDPILNGADPVLGQDMIPVIIADDGTVKYANLYTKWYEYETKRWANAVILTKDGKKKDFETGDKIDEEYIESYFVWIPRYKYKIWDLGNYTNNFTLDNLRDTKDDSSGEYALRHMIGNAKLINIIFETKDVSASKTQQVGQYYTHPAFINFDVNGLWVGKFEITGDINNITVKPGITSWRGATVGTFWHSLFDYKRNLDSHMMKNTEWGAVAYLSHSIYGIGTEVNINNNSAYLTGYSASLDTDQSSFPGESGTTIDVTQPYNTITGYLASTTGNITGIYDMSGGGADAVAAYLDGYGETSSSGVSSGLTNSVLSTYAKYFDKYSADETGNSYNQRILGDATGELGPFYLYYDKDKNQRIHNIKYGDLSRFLISITPWFVRGGEQYHAVLAGQYAFYSNGSNLGYWCTSRLVLAVQ